MSHYLIKSTQYMNSLLRFKFNLKIKFLYEYNLNNNKPEWE